MARRSDQGPTLELYRELERAYLHFNRVLFDNILPAGILTLQRKPRRMYGYFAGDRFGHRRRPLQPVDELAMNPMHFGARSTRDTLSTLAHEMVHVWHGSAGFVPESDQAIARIGEWLKPKLNLA